MQDKAVNTIGDKLDVVKFLRRQMLMDEMLKISLSTLERLFLVRNKKFVLTDGTGD